MWGPPLKPSTAWFFFVCYLALLSSCVVAVYFLGDFTSESCNTLSVAERYILEVQEILVGGKRSGSQREWNGSHWQTFQSPCDPRVFAALAAAALVTIGLGVLPPSLEGQNGGDVRIPGYVHGGNVHSF
ncbi:hypothetical protein DFH09DRAFT_1110072 [Mycena vulgaris]|nr:hypothetical protein DFH09DRAFT_1110072 [Mycena vulgaris]